MQIYQIWDILTNYVFIGAMDMRVGIPAGHASNNNKSNYLHNLIIMTSG